MYDFFLFLYNKELIKKNAKAGIARIVEITRKNGMCPT